MGMTRISADNGGCEKKIHVQIEVVACGLPLKIGVMTVPAYLMSQIDLFGA